MRFLPATKIVQLPNGSWAKVDFCVNTDRIITFLQLTEDESEEYMHGARTELWLDFSGQPDDPISSSGSGTLILISQSVRDVKEAIEAMGRLNIAAYGIDQWLSVIHRDLMEICKSLDSTKYDSESPPSPTD